MSAPAGAWRPRSKVEVEKWQKTLQNSRPIKPITLLADQEIAAEDAFGGSQHFACAGNAAAAHGQQSGFLREGSTGGAGGGGAGGALGSPEAKMRGADPPRKLLDGFLLLEACHVEFPDEATRAVLHSRNVADVAPEDLQYFNNLAYLDLGANRVRLEMLTGLPALEELHLHCNMIKDIPASLPDGCFAHLHVLDLSYNVLSVDAVGALAQLPKLRELDLTCNALTALPSNMEHFLKLEVLSLERNKLERDVAFLLLSKVPRLRELNVSFNYFRRVPEKVAEAQGFPSLEWLNLANNYIASEVDLLALVDLPRLVQVILYGNPITGARADLPLLNDQQADGRVVNLVTDPPDLRKRKTGRGSYAHFRIAKVVEPVIPSASQWKAAGNRQLFGAPDLAAASAPPPAAPRAEAGDDDEEQEQEQEAKGGGFFLTETGDEFLGGGGGGAGPRDDGLTVPPQLLQEPLMGGANQAPNPTKLRMAVNALRYALKHPLTSHAGGDGGTKKSFERMTKLQIARMRPRRPYVPGRARAKGRKGRKGRAVAGDDGGGARQPSALSNIEYVLDRMNNRMAAVEADLGAAMQSEQSMSSLIASVNKVMETYENEPAD